MNKPMTSLTNWRVESSQRVRLPKYFEVASLGELRSRLQEYADHYRPSEDNPPLGDLLYSYELDDHDQVELIRVHYRNKHNRRGRFARLRLIR